ncbi:MAG: pyridoxine 5'-phosphate synthase [Pseudomonadales bacterium]|nr:pyridoxine 5'-phosphate synthase [Pseudomonadales bacterium]
MPNATSNQNTTPLLGVNIDHIATLRQARGTRYPDPIEAAFIAEKAGADGITLHLREDRRHIQDRDLFMLKETIQTRINFEMAVTAEMIAIAEQIKPRYCCLVPEKREELTTEGGLNVVQNLTEISTACERLARSGIEVSLFIDPDFNQINAAITSGAPLIEIHTGGYADAETPAQAQQELERIQQAVEYANQKGLIVNAGHGLHYHNVKAIAAIPDIYELNIGHAIISRAVLTGLDEAVRQMKSLINSARVTG